MPGKLKNRTRRALVFNLTLKVAPVRQLFPRRVERKDGSVGIEDRRLVLPASVTVLAGKLSASLPDGVPHCPEVSAAIARREVEWIPDAEPVSTRVDTSEPAAPTPPEPAAPTDDAAHDAVEPDAVETSPRARRRGNG